MTLITTSSDLETFCIEAEGASYITVDTEFIRESTYWPKLCLIQVGLENKAVAIDAMAPGLNLSSFFSLLQNPNVTKVFHAGRQDIEIFYHLTEAIPTPVFDTQIAAMVCGFGESIAYEALVKRYTKISLDKSMRYTHWGQRPLTDKQLAYALGDVIHLRPIYEQLLKQITSADRLHWVENELGILTNPATYVLDPYAMWQRLRIRSPKPRLLAVLREIAAWREITAQQRNVPRVRVIRDEVLLELAASCPQSEKDLHSLRGYTRSLMKAQEEKEVLSLIQKALALPLEDCPQVLKSEDSSQGSSALVEMLRLLLKIKSEKFHVAQKLIATTKDLEDIARSSSPTSPALQGWRYDIFGEAALALKQGKIALGLKNNKITLLEVK